MSEIVEINDTSEMTVYSIDTMILQSDTCFFFFFLTISTTKEAQILAGIYSQKAESL